MEPQSTSKILASLLMSVVAVDSTRAGSVHAVTKAASEADVSRVETELVSAVLRLGRVVSKQLEEVKAEVDAVVLNSSG